MSLWETYFEYFSNYNEILAFWVMIIIVSLQIKVIIERRWQRRNISLAKSTLKKFSNSSECILIWSKLAKTNSFPKSIEQIWLKKHTRIKLEMRSELPVKNQWSVETFLTRSLQVPQSNYRRYLVRVPCHYTVNNNQFE